MLRACDKKSPPQMDYNSKQSGTHFTKSLRAHNPNLVKIYFAFTLKTTIISGHNFADVTTAELSWHVQNYDLIGWLKSRLLIMSCYGPFVTWVQLAPPLCPDHRTSISGVSEVVECNTVAKAFNQAPVQPVTIWLNFKYDLNMFSVQ